MIRDATPADSADLLRLIRGLAEYEREPTAVETTEEDLHRALFGEHPTVFALVAEDSGSPVGMALYFHTFSTWTGRPTLYLEDLFVEPAHRGRGWGQALLQGLAERAVGSGCARMEWSVLDWNEPAIGFYRAFGAVPMREWTVYRLSGPELAAAARAAAEPAGG